jgi:hypothetical protein
MHLSQERNKLFKSPEQVELSGSPSEEGHFKHKRFFVPANLEREIFNGNVS